VLNAANEVAVAAFLRGGLGFAQIPELIERVVDVLPATGAQSLEVLLDADARARELANTMLPLVSRV
jgi:1-deoxy-D-xylulose-5-phosphate reductoisomerase